MLLRSILFVMCDELPLSNAEDESASSHDTVDTIHALSVLRLVQVGDTRNLLRTRLH